MADVLTTPRREIDYGRLGQYVAQPFAQQQSQEQAMYQALLPVVFKAKIEQKMQSDLIDKLVNGGNGPQGDFDISIGPGGVTYKQKSPKEKMEDILAGKRMSAMSGQVPPIVNDIVPQTSGQIPPVVSSVMGGLPPQTIPNPNFPYEDKPTIENPMFKPAMERQTKLQETIGKEEAASGNAIALLDSLEKDWEATNPTKVTNNGKFSPLGVIKGIVNPAYTGEQWLGAGMQITPNQRADRKYIRRVNSLMSRLAKGVIGQDVGNLSAYEQTAAKGGIAGLGDTYEFGKDIFASAKQMVLDMKQARVEGYKSLDEKLRAEGRTLTSDKAAEYLKLAGGDKEKARQLAVKDRWVF